MTIEKTTAREAEKLIKRIADGEIEEVRLILSKPLPQGKNGDLTELRIAEPSVRMLTHMDGARGEMAKMKNLIASLNDEPDVIFDNMGARDMIAASALLAAFLGVSPPTGVT